MYCLSVWNKNPLVWDAAGHFRILDYASERDLARIKRIFIQVTYGFKKNFIATRMYFGAVARLLVESLY